MPTTLHLPLAHFGWLVSLAEARAAAQQRMDSEHTELTYCECAMWNMLRDPREIESQECARPRPSVCVA